MTHTSICAEKGSVVITILEAVITGILAGGVYALMASGLTLIFGVMKIVNLAQGILVILGSYLSYTIEHYLHFDPFIGLIFTMPIMFVIGYGIQWAFVRRLKRDQLMLSILVMFAVGMIIEGLLNLIYTPDFVQLHSWYVTASFPIWNGFYLPYSYVFLLILSIVLMTALYVIIYRTKFGYSMRAATQNRTAASLIGIDVEQVSAITFGIGTALAAAGGLGYAMSMPFDSTNSYDLIPRLLVIIILGGMGSLTGALVGSLLMLVIWHVTAAVWSDSWSSTVFYVLLIVLLLFRSQGLFGRLEGRKQ
jgi:branched-chain amino acid transport system permease protein